MKSIDLKVLKAIKTIVNVILIIIFFIFALTPILIIYKVYGLFWLFLIIIVSEKAIEFIFKSMIGVMIEIEDFLKWILEIITYGFLLWNIYTIVLSKEVLYINYWFIIFTIVALVTISNFKKVQKIVINESIRNKKWNIIGSIFMIFISSSLFLYQTKGIFTDEKIIYLSDIETPEKLVINKYSYDKSKGMNAVSLHSKDRVYEIKNKTIIEKLISELNNKKIENLRGIDRIDYDIKRLNEINYYTFKLNQSELEKTNNKDRLHIININFLEDGTMVISIHDWKLRDIQRYKTTLSYELIESLINIDLKSK